VVVNYNIRHQEPGLTIMDFTGQLTLGKALKGVEYAISDGPRAGAGRSPADSAVVVSRDRRASLCASPVLCLDVCAPA
jgi:hypothetical protein